MSEEQGSCDLYRQVFEESSDALLVLDADGRCVAVNRRGSELLGSLGELKTGPTLLDQLAAAQPGTDICARTLADKRVLITVRDTVDRAQVEALREREETYRSLVESAQDPMFKSAPDGRYLYVNPVAAALLGKTPDQVIGKTPEELFPPHVAQRYRKGVQRVIKTGETLKAHELSEVNGRQMWFSSIVQPVFDRQGNVVAAQAVVRDITAFKVAEQALRESEERLRQAVRVSHIGIFDHDHVAGTLYFSPEQRDIWSIGRDEPVSLSGSPAETMESWDLAHPDDRAQIATALERAHDPRGDGLFDLEHRIIRRDGSIRWLTTRSQTFFEGEGEARRPVRTVGAVLDVTERRTAEAEQQALQARLLQAQKMESVGRLAGGVAHDFNNMLNVICGYAELALDQLGSGHPVYTLVDEIRKAGRRSVDLTGQLLAFARRQPVTPKVLDLNECVERSLNMLRRLIGENIRTVWRPGQRPWSVRIDPTQVDQILMNLSVNARDAITGVGEITIQTSNVTLNEAACKQHPGSVPGEYVMLEVIDTGDGMDAEIKSHLFEPFFTTKADGQGTGLGLATVYGIVKQNDGLITISSEVGKGTIVQILFPRFTGAQRKQRPRAGDGPKGGTETVLLVEDEPMVLGLSKHMLEALGYTVLPAGTPSEALRLADEQGENIHLLLTDVVMPEMNGPDLARRLMAAHPHLKCMFVSGYLPGSSTMRTVLDDGVHFLQKPFSVGDLAARVRQALGAT